MHLVVLILRFVLGGLYRVASSYVLSLVIFLSQQSILLLTNYHLMVVEKSSTVCKVYGKENYIFTEENDEGHGEVMKSYVFNFVYYQFFFAGYYYTHFKPKDDASKDSFSSSICLRFFKHI